MKVDVRLTVLLCLVAVGVHSPSQAAEPSGSNDVTAQALFDEAKGLAAHQRWAEACPKLEESQRREPRMVTLYRLADCYEHIGRPASAWMLFLDAASRARDTGEVAREKVASERALALERTLPRIVVNVPAVPGIHVVRDGATLTPEQWGVRVPVDPGPHTIVASAPGKKAFTTVATVSGRGAVVTVSIPALADSTPEPEPSDFAKAVTTQNVASATPPDEAHAEVVTSSPRSPAPNSGLVLGGAIMLGVGGTLVASAVALYATGSPSANEPCSFRKCALPALIFWPGLALTAGGGALLLGETSKRGVAVSAIPWGGVVRATF